MTAQFLKNKDLALSESGLCFPESNLQKQK